MVYPILSNSSKSKVQLCSEVEKCPFLLPKASIFPWVPKSLTVFHPLAKFTASYHSFCEQTVFSVWQIGAFWRQKNLRNISWKGASFSAFCILQAFFYYFVESLQQSTWGLDYNWFGSIYDQLGTTGVWICLSFFLIITVFNCFPCELVLEHWPKEYKNFFCCCLKGGIK